MKTKTITACLGFLFTCAAHAQSPEENYPTRAVTLVVPTAAGGSNSIIARLIAQKLQSQLGQGIIVENKPGANSAIGAQYVAKAKPDGYTLLLTGAATFTTNPILYPNLGYKPQDFDYVAITGKTPLVLITNTETGFKSVSDVIAAARKSPGMLAYASFGSGSTAHLAGESFSRKANISLIHTAYKGSTPGLADLMGNQIPLSFDTLPAALPLIKAKKIVALAVTTESPFAQLPNVPTIASTGLGEFNFAAWFVLAAPKGTPVAVLKRIEEATKAAMGSADLQQSLLLNGIENTFMDGAAVNSLMNKEMEHNKVIIRQANIKPE
ncbi:Bug family tripartite tricarboxylate transporter substrate binding protein [Achromobacter aloeverae]|uniref:ABC transporter substrate-binding protein n=1 Tax=Achromobacter aloeverae TaxID=1750518 RepID=A0A4Q1HJ88_9BURK|nr:tripartite tricarboxylate transporter substrate binding protein [Achromobacter aloeverae]RXN90154.1 ABC transporter substrate-binding protein [Achromobacter aloeverae]